MSNVHGRAASIYDELRETLDASDLARRLGLEVVRDVGGELHIKPLCHESSSGESLHLNVHTGRWLCRACVGSGVSGDLIQLAEYARSNGAPPSRGMDQKNSPAHREAMRWLCQEYGVVWREGGGCAELDVVHLVAMEAHRALIESPEVLDWIAEKWGFDLGVVQEYGIGFLPSPMPIELVEEARRPESHSAFRASGVGWFDAKSGQFRSALEGRVLFPYLQGGRAMYLIGRSTPWTPPGNGGYVAKYHKLAVHSSSRPWISERISNDHLYLEDVLRTASRVVVTEGVADAVALSSIGAPVVSPVTIRINSNDIDRFAKRCRDHSIQRVEILFDNELSGSGSAGARSTGAQLVERGLAVSILSIPLGPEQQAASDEVEAELGAELWEEYLLASPNDRKRLVEAAVEGGERRAWIERQIDASKIDAAEWVAQRGAAASTEFEKIRAAGVDVIDVEVAEAARACDPGAEPIDRLNVFSEPIRLAAYVDEQLYRDRYAKTIAAAAGKGVTKAIVGKRIAAVRRDEVKPKRKEAKDEADRQAAQLPDLVAPPPSPVHTPPAAPAAPVAPSSAPVDPDAPAAPKLPETAPESEHDRFASCRAAVIEHVGKRVPEEAVGEFIAQTILGAMGYTAFLVEDDLFLVRGNERVPVAFGVRASAFNALAFTCSGLTTSKASHKPYLMVATHFLRKSARRVDAVSWSYVDSEDGIYFPLGDAEGSLVKITEGKLERTSMAEAQVPAVSGANFQPVRFVAEPNGVDEALGAFRWLSFSPGDAMILVYWIAALPLLRRVKNIPIVRIEGGASSGKSRATHAVSFLVNGAGVESVPTPAAMISHLSTEMLTIDDNREADDMSRDLIGTMLQATHLGSRTKRQAKSDTGVVRERICGALLNNGVEPIHSGKSELASRMLVLRCDLRHADPESPREYSKLERRILSIRDAFWSDALRRCSVALELDNEFGEVIGAEIERLFASTRIGRLSTYLRIMYFCWVAGYEGERRRAFASSLCDIWADAWRSIGAHVLGSLVLEELSVTAIRYAFAWGRQGAEGAYQGDPRRVGLRGKYQSDDALNTEALGPFSAPQLARVIRTASKELGGPRSISSDLKAGQLEARILDGIGFLRDAGVEVQVETTHAGKHRFTFGKRLDTTLGAEVARAGGPEGEVDGPF